MKVGILKKHNEYLYLGMHPAPSRNKAGTATEGIVPGCQECLSACIHFDGAFKQNSKTV